MAHTPGPWVWTQGDKPVAIEEMKRHGYQDNPILVNGNQMIIGCDEYWILDGENDGKDNARLIAAAPELLAALQAMVQRYCDDPQLDSPIDEAARAAIAKATGTKH